MSDILYVEVKDWQEARDSCPDQPAVLVRVYSFGVYLRYRGEFHKIDVSSSLSAYVRSSDQWWSIAGVGFTYDSIAWMIDNSIAYPFSQEDLVLYQLTWGDSCE